MLRLRPPLPISSRELGGIKRFSIMWSESNMRRVIRPTAEWGYQVNIYGVPDLEAFLQAALMLPASLTSDVLWTRDEPSEFTESAPCGCRFCR